jgi:hypothetical protein
MPHAIDVQYFPDHNVYLERQAKLAAINGGKFAATLPASYPLEIETEMTWSRGSFVQDEWIIQLDQCQIREINLALDFFKSKKERLHLVIFSAYHLIT